MRSPHVPRRLHRHADLVAVTAGGLLAASAGQGPARGTGLALLSALGLPLALGYALVAALFPGGPAVARRPGDTNDSRPTATERVVLAVVAGAALTALQGVALSALGALSPGTATGLLLAETLGAAGVAALRRAGVGKPAPGESDGSSSGRPVRDAVAVLGPAAALGVTVVAVLAAGWMGALAVGVGDAPLTEFHVSGAGGAAADLPDTLAGGESLSVAVTVENGADRPRTFTVVVAYQEPASGDGSRPRTTTRRTRSRLEVPGGGRETRKYTLDPPAGRHRIAYLLYEGGAPPTPSVDAASQRLHHWITVGNRTRENGTARASAARPATDFPLVRRGSG